MTGSYRGRPGARHLERSATRQAPLGSSRRHVFARPVTAEELAKQLREMLPHDSLCRWATHARRRPGEPLERTEIAMCTCTAVSDRTHLLDLLRASAAGQLPAAVLAGLGRASSTGARP